MILYFNPFESVPDSNGEAKLALQNGEEAPGPRSPGFSLQPPLSTDTELRDCADVRAQLLHHGAAGIPAGRLLHCGR